MGMSFSLKRLMFSLRNIVNILMCKDLHKLNVGRGGEPSF